MRRSSEVAGTLQTCAQSWDGMAGGFPVGKRSHEQARFAPPPLVLSGHAASLTPYQSDTPRPLPRTDRTRRVTRAGALCAHGAGGARAQRLRGARSSRETCFVLSAERPLWAQILRDHLVEQNGREMPLRFRGPAPLPCPAPCSVPALQRRKRSVVFAFLFAFGLPALHLPARCACDREQRAP